MKSRARSWGWMTAVLALGGSISAWALQATEAPKLELAQSQNLTVSIQGSLGYLNGEAHEIVYETLDDGSRYKLSELIWDMKDIVMGGANASLGIMNRVNLNAGYWAPLTKGRGQMEDYDWLLMEQGTPWTDWSLSDVDVVRGYIWDINASVDALRFESFILRGLVGYKQNFWRWEDSGVRHIYSTDPAYDDGFRDDIGEDDGSNGINYEQTFKIPYFGAGLDWTYQQFSLAAYFTYSPFVKAEDKDNHLFRNLEFVETFDNGTYYGLGLRASYAFTSRFFASVALDYQEVREIIGDTTITDLSTGETFSSSDSAGIDNKATQFSLSLGYVF